MYKDNGCDLSEVIPADTQQVAVVGIQWGDEGKGKVGDSLNGRYTHSASPNGGPNAGHNIMFQGKKLHFHLLPGAVMSGTPTYLAQGKVICLKQLAKEIAELKACLPNHGVITIAAGAQVIVESVQTFLDIYIEESKQTQSKVGSTKKGVGPAYALKALRLSPTIGDLIYGEYESQVCNIQKVFPYLEGDVLNDFDEARDQLLTLMHEDGVKIDLNNRYVPKTLQDPTQKIIVECAQSVMLSLSSGMYPFVTASECGFNAIPVHLNTETPGYKIGVAKAIVSKVGEGRFPTLWDNAGLSQELIKQYRDEAGEYGATTGRPRSIGFLDAVALRHVFTGGNRPDLLRVNMADKLPFLHQHGIPNQIATSYETYHSTPPMFGDSTIETYTHEVPPPYIELKHIEYTQLSDVKGPADYPRYVDELRKVLERTGPIVLGTGPAGHENVLFK